MLNNPLFGKSQTKNRYHFFTFCHQHYLFIWNFLTRNHWNKFFFFAKKIAIYFEKYDSCIWPDFVSKESRVVRQLLKNSCFYARRIGQEGHLSPSYTWGPTREKRTRAHRSGKKWVICVRAVKKQKKLCRKTFGGLILLSLDPPAECAFYALEGGLFFRNH